MTTKLPAIPGVWVNSKQCPFGSSVFDEILSMQEEPNHHQQQHYDRTIVSLQQSEGNLVLHPCRISEETEGIPFGRARECPELGLEPALIMPHYNDATKGRPNISPYTIWPIANLGVDNAVLDGGP
eukprot:scaffold3977_cov96-Cylindrotheca_fusiformis.AAC.3